MFIAGLGWGDWLGGLFIGGFAKAVFIQHATFFINSLAHFWGDFTYSDQRTPRDSYIVSLFTFGEGYHNFHHEFPYDYRNGLRWMHYDPGKFLTL
jgi:stearoyl-CoA desaturase (delta-9 desaturase)